MTHLVVDLGGAQNIKGILTPIGVADQAVLHRQEALPQWRLGLDGEAQGAAFATALGVTVVRRADSGVRARRRLWGGAK